MSDGFVTDAFETTSGDVWYQANDELGRTYHVKQGEGQKSQQAFAAAKSHTPETAAVKRGETPDLSSTQTYDREISVPTTAIDRGTVEYRLGVNRNKWLGFFKSDDTPDDKEAAFDQYSQMIEDLNDADTPDEREGIRRAYGLGGS